MSPYELYLTRSITYLGKSDLALDDSNLSAKPLATLPTFAEPLLALLD